MENLKREGNMRQAFTQTVIKTSRGVDEHLGIGSGHGLALPSHRGVEPALDSSNGSISTAVTALHAPKACGLILKLNYSSLSN
jgi:hypothetical protein